jgi:hypothetical protein
MRQTISGLVAAIAAVAASAAPAMACGGLFDSCLPCGYASPCAIYGFERLPDPEAQYHTAPVRQPQYYYVNQGPTYTGPGNFAPYPIYREGGVSGWSAYHHWRHHHRYGSGGPVLRRYY